LQDDARRDGVGETSSAATPATGITEVGSSGLLARDSISRGSNDLDFASQTNDHLDSALIDNLEVEAGNLISTSFSSLHLNIFTLIFAARKNRSFITHRQYELSD
jgi:hypothetical protein